MAKLRRGNLVWDFVTAGQHVGNQAKMHGDRKLRCNFCGHLFQGNAGKAVHHFTQAKYCKAVGMRVPAEIWNDTDYTFKPATSRRVQRWMADEGVRDMRAAAGGQQQRMDEGERDEIQDALDQEEGLEGGVGEGGTVDEAVRDPDLPGEEVVMTSRGVGRVERVYFTYGGGPDGMGSHTSVITDDVPSTGQASATDVLEQEPQGGLWTTGRSWEVRSDNEHEREAEEEEVPRQDRHYSPSHHRTTAPPEALRRSERLASTAGRKQTHDSKEREGEMIPSGSGIRPRSSSELRTYDFDVGHTGGGLGDFSAPERRHASPSEVHTDDFDLRGRVETEEERDARLDREEEDRLRTLPGWEDRVAFLEEQRR
ncbi:hypothetical protein CBR_g39086 [Chara braunii]|uniref:BED-type domain-containing protein n=1 Tax=Chara braunii TaxID=69332 RepID=A0A388LQV2_CHABU|nr:hypothetical protein CBR_g39086 [Chara braunii]|eukprot:GBG84710.1 hypothetical protein CBR_g39086 [Chara braunii]